MKLNYYQTDGSCWWHSPNEDYSWVEVWMEFHAGVQNLIEPLLTLIFTKWKFGSLKSTGKNTQHELSLCISRASIRWLLCISFWGDVIRGEMNLHFNVLFLYLWIKILRGKWGCVKQVFPSNIPDCESGAEIPELTNMRLLGVLRSLSFYRCLSLRFQRG